MALLQVIFFLLVAAVVTVKTNNDKMWCVEELVIPLGTRNRPDPNQLYLHPLQGTSNMIRHHIFSYAARIRTLFNRAISDTTSVRADLWSITQNLQRNAREHYGLRITELREHDMDLVILPELVPDHILDHPFIDFTDDSVAYEELYPNRIEPNPNHLTAIQTLWAWMPFNIAIGPGRRGDDDQQSPIDYPVLNFIAEPRRRELLNSLDRRMNRYLAAAAESDLTREQTFRQVRDVIITLINEFPRSVPYDSTQWVEDQRGYWQARQDYDRRRRDISSELNSRLTLDTGRPMNRVERVKRSTDKSHITCFTELSRWGRQTERGLTIGKTMSGFESTTDYDTASSCNVQFAYTVQSNTYLYAQSFETKYWFIRSLTSDGKMGPTVGYGYWNNNYHVQVPFSIGDKVYFYGHNLDNRYWFIQELNFDGSMGKETDSGHWQNCYAIQFTFTIDGETYLYGYNIDTRYWFIQRLLEGGKMGLETDADFMDVHRQVQFPVSTGTRLFLFGRTTTGNGLDAYATRELLHGGRMSGVETEHGLMGYPYNISIFPGYIFGCSNDKYDVGCRTASFTSDGLIMSSNKISNSPRGEHNLFIPYFSDKKTFLYSYNITDYSWKIEKM